MGLSVKSTMLVRATERWLVSGEKLRRPEIMDALSCVFISGMVGNNCLLNHRCQTFYFTELREFHVRQYQ